MTLASNINTNYSNNNNTRNIIDKYFYYEDIVLKYLDTVPYINNYTYHKVSGRITLFLLTMGILAIINEICISLDMYILSKNTYNEINSSDLQSLKKHKLLLEKHFKNDGTGHSFISNDNEETLQDFFSKPVPVAHLTVTCAVINSKDGYKPILKTPLVYQFEFTTNELYTYDNNNNASINDGLEYGCKLVELRRKLYHFFKDSSIYEELSKNTNINFTISKNIFIYNNKDELLDSSFDDYPLCFLKLETGNVIKCEFLI
ncbi:uncharacterized protein SCODWIG_02121 [Saccharomycodes ludwigii]|uniref:Uncharacterized protein n=1 Tax=Saccharomycodes ludwigii TaxID=36035 RepID=A0A376B891_9ASCO|nr:hypothetical protein SCDLUD_002637 [Saccharomycodes ludwigii]KAH3901154.1 hypothetical protein SCDLUD_002637 [Saccharomycodes ludwigii]SSD60360.1 uncharacterized protein SCODWIG_02121 [Saccharomycodes ludwigii]